MLGSCRIFLYQRKVIQVFAHSGLTPSCPCNPGVWAAPQEEAQARVDNTAPEQEHSWLLQGRREESGFLAKTGYRTEVLGLDDMHGFLVLGGSKKEQVDR